MTGHTNDDAITIDWLEQLRDEDDDQADTELAIVPAWTQSAWDRHHVAQIQAAEAAEAYLHANVGDVPDSVLIRGALLILGRPRAAAAVMSPHGPGTTTAEDAGTIYAAMRAPAPEVKPVPVRKPRQAPRRRSSKPRGSTS